MKIQKLIIAIIASFVFAATANAQFGDFINKAKNKIDKVQKQVEQTTKNLPQSAAQKANRNWVVFTGYQTVAVERSPVAAKYTCENSIYATANFASNVDLTGGFYVTISADGKLVIQEKMTVEGNPGARRSIPVDIIPDDDADLGFPEASLDFSHALLTELKAGIHNVTVAVSVGDGNDEQIAAGTFSFDNRRGCSERFERVERLINGTATGEAETGETSVEQSNDDEPVAPPTRPQPSQQPRTELNYITFFNNCAERQLFNYRYPDGTVSSVFVEPGFPSTNQYPVGTQFWHGSSSGGDPFYVMPKSQYTNEMDKARSADRINLCQ